MLSVTGEGRATLRTWLVSQVDLEAASSIHDSVRTRVFFLDLLPPAARLDVIQGALRASEEHIEAIERDLEERRASGDHFGQLGAQGAWHAARARVLWLQEIEEELAAETE